MMGKGVLDPRTVTINPVFQKFSWKNAFVSFRINALGNPKLSRTWMQVSLWS